MNLEQGAQVADIFGIARRRGKLIATVAGAVTHGSEKTGSPECV